MNVAVIGYGNPGRGDDAAGPLLAERVESWDLPGVRVASDYQLNVEHAADVADSGLAIFIDASRAAEDPFEFSKLAAENRNDFTTHAMLPETVLETSRRVYGKLPPAYVLAVRGEKFDLGQEPDSEMRRRLDAAAGLLERILRSDDPAEACREAAGDN